MRALWSAATGMLAQQLNVDTVANNLANINTTGFKASRLEFQDLIYQHLPSPGSVQGGQPPAALLQVGHGVQPVATQRLFSQGSLEPTDNPLDLAIQGRGFFQVELPGGTRAYTRDGSFKLDAEGNLVTSNGYRLVLEDGEEVPLEADALEVAADGTITAVVRDDDGEVTRTEIGRINLATFINPAGLQAMGQNLFLATPASGEPETARPGEGGVGYIQQGYLEASNVNVVQEMVALIVAQRAYEMNSKAIQASDEMMGLANNLRR